MLPNRKSPLQAGAAAPTVGCVGDIAVQDLLIKHVEFVVAGRLVSAMIQAPFQLGLWSGGVSAPTPIPAASA